MSGVEITGSMSENVPSTGSGTGIMNGYNKVIEPVEITGRNKNLPSIGSGTGSSSKYNTVIELVEITGMRIRMCLRQAQAPKATR